MGDLVMNLNFLRGQLKIRYLILTIIVISLVFILPLVLPIGKNYHPVYSIHSEMNYGHSRLRNYLMPNYELDTFNLGIHSYEENMDAYILLNPQLNPETGNFWDYLSYIKDLTISGVPVIIIGDSGLIRQNSEYYFQVTYMDTGDELGDNSELFDPINNGGEAGYPLVKYGDGENDYAAVTPKPVFVNQLERSSKLLSTYSTASMRSCYGECVSSYDIGVVNPSSRFAIIADNWMFSNVITRSYSQNLELFQLILQDLGIVSGKIVFDETFYEWAPLNEDGVKHFIRYKFNTILLYLLLVVFSIILPIIVGFTAGVFTREISTETSPSNLDARLSSIHIEKLPAAPLTLEERLLVNEKLELSSRHKFYYQYVGYRMLKFIETHSLTHDIPNQILQKLELMSKTILPDTTSWEIIIETNNVISELISDLNPNQLRRNAYEN